MLKALAEVTLRNGTPMQVILYEPPEEAYAGQTAQIGSSSWKQRVTIGIGQRGLYLQPKGAVVRYTALEVPWSHMRQEGDGVLQGEEMARIMVVPPQVGLLVPRDVWAKAERYAKR